jgi:hypothetical protein
MTPLEAVAKAICCPDEDERCVGGRCEAAMHLYATNATAAIAAYKAAIREPIKMDVYVVMSNDYPDCVFNNEASAKAYCEAKMREQKERRDPGRGIIYWRYYQFELLTENVMPDKAEG